MPFIKVLTNKPSAHKKENSEELRALVTQCLGKPAEFTLVELGETYLSWGGRPEGRALGIIEIRAVDLDFSKTQDLSKLLAEWTEKTLGIKKEDLFINFLSFPGAHWGWNGGTF